MKTDENQTQTRLIARLLREVVAAEDFTTLADAVDALKFRCARLRIGWTNDGISQALRVVGSNRRLVR